MIFKNKKGAEKHPDYRGQVMVNGEVKDVALWINESKAGNKYLNGVLSEPRAEEAQADMNENKEDLPF